MKLSEDLMGIDYAMMEMIVLTVPSYKKARKVSAASFLLSRAVDFNKPVRLPLGEYWLSGQNENVDLCIDIKNDHEISILFCESKIVVDFCAFHGHLLDSAIQCLEQGALVVPRIYSNDSTVYGVSLYPILLKAISVLAEHLGEGWKVPRKEYLKRRKHIKSD